MLSIVTSTRSEFRFTFDYLLSMIFRAVNIAEFEYISSVFLDINTLEKQFFLAGGLTVSFIKVHLNRCNMLQLAKHWPQVL